MNDMTYDFNNVKPDIRENIPAGIPLYLQMNYTPGGAGPSGILTASKPSAENPTPDTKYLKAEFTVLRGPYKGRKFWSNLTLEGGQVDEKGNSKARAIAMQTLFNIIASAHGLKREDPSADATAIRAQYSDLKKFNGVRFFSLSSLSKPQKGYPEKNELGGHWNILTVDSSKFPTEAQLDNPTVTAGPKLAVVAALPSFVTAQQPTQANGGQSAAPNFPPPAAVPTPNGSLPAWMQ